ncbi:MAG: hypothetical protein PHR77_16080 [Kiritimatiellae bacterium]|nr:hypothetical protein [Kiritimatiellia bacterium]MDD5523418.1 hypothetical protein [Kiritimatiellia bacterium]
MSKRSYICTKCRTSRRAESSGGVNTSLRCGLCRGPLWELEWRWRIPKKTDDKGWKELERKVAHDSAAWLPRKRQIGEEEIRKVDKAIQTLEMRKATPAKAEQMRKLRNQKLKILRKYTEPSSACDSQPCGFRSHER